MNTLSMRLKRVQSLATLAFIERQRGLIAGRHRFFAIEPEISRAFERPSWGLGLFVMRYLLVLIALIFFNLRVIGLGAPASKILQLSDGTLSGGIYSNDVLGLRYQIPSGWIATVGSSEPVSLDYRPPDGRPASQCLKTLLLMHSQQAESGFNSQESLFAIDPACFSEAKFPTSVNDKKKILRVADAMTKFFSKTPYISRHTADVGTVSLAGRVVVVLTGDDVLSAGDGGNKTKEALHVNTLICVTESNGYWVGWAASADDPAREQLRNTNMSFQVSKLRNDR